MAEIMAGTLFVFPAAFCNPHATREWLKTADLQSCSLSQARQRREANASAVMHFRASDQLDLPRKWMVRTDTLGDGHHLRIIKESTLHYCWWESRECACPASLDWRSSPSWLDTSHARVWLQHRKSGYGNPEQHLRGGMTAWERESRRRHK